MRGGARPCCSFICPLTISINQGALKVLRPTYFREAVPMVKVYIRTEVHHYVRALTIECEDCGRIVLWGDPTKAVAMLLIFNNSEIKSWTAKGLEVDLSDEVYEAIKALSKRPVSWKEAAEGGLLKNPTPQHVLQALSLKTILK